MEKKREKGVTDNIKSGSSEFAGQNTLSGTGSSENKAFRCTVCGYIHRGAEAPEMCPVCGAQKELFEEYMEKPEKPASLSTELKCEVCGHEHTGDQPPERCPVCGAPAEKFKNLSEKMDGDSGHYVIVGAGAAGVSAAESVRDISDSARVSILNRDTFLPYFRLNLTRYLAGELKKEDLWIHKKEWYEENNIYLSKNTEVSDLLLEKKEIILSSSKRIKYDKLILTAGADPFIPPIPGSEKEGVVTLRSLDDAHTILEKIKTAENIVIIGGGILGLETAGAISRHDKKAVIIENFEWLMPRQLNRTAAHLLKSHLENLGISLETAVFTQKIVGDKRVTGVMLENSKTIPADMVIIAAGVRSNTSLAARAGVEINQGIVVNNYMQTSYPDVYAAGDITEHKGVLYGFWSAAQYQGSIAGMNAAGKQVEFGGIPRSNTIKVLDIDLLSIGRFEAEDENDNIIEGRYDGHYFCFLFCKTRLAGSILYGNISIGNEVKSAIETAEDLSHLLSQNPDVKDILKFFSSRIHTG